MADEELQFDISLNPDAKGMLSALDDVGKKADAVVIGFAERFKSELAKGGGALIGGQGIGGRLGQLGGIIGKAVTGDETGAVIGGKFSDVVTGKGEGGRAKALGGAVGSAAGMAVGGPVGAAVGGQIGEVVGGIIGKIPEAIAMPVKAATAGLSAFDSSLKELTGILGPLGVGFNVLSSGAEKAASMVKIIPLLGDVLGPMADALAVVPGIFKSITETLVGFAAKASPGTFQQYAVALEDVQGVIGGSFLPVMDLMTRGIRLFGDVLADLLPNSQEVSAALTDVYDAFAEFRTAMKEMTAELGPVIRSGIIAALNVLGQIAKEVAGYVTSLVRAMQPWITQLRQFLGISASDNRSSVGAAAQPARFSGIEEYQRQLQEAALSSGGGATAADMPQMVSEIQTMMNRVFDWLRETIGGFVSGFWAVLRSMLESITYPIRSIGNLLGIT